MPLDLTGITNHHEYHSQHYLLALFEGDLQELPAKTVVQNLRREDNFALITFDDAE